MKRAGPVLLVEEDVVVVLEREELDEVIVAGISVSCLLI